jgi:transcriptional regulator with XRE-family HTH domain
MRPKSPWTHAHAKLKRLYDERIGSKMTQAEFGKRYGIGNQSMVAQYLNGTRPLNYDVAAKFARALGCKIEDFCPEMANSLAYDILPFVGKALRRAAVFLLVLLAQGFVPSESNATSHNQYSSGHFFAKSLTGIHILGLWLVRWMSALFAPMGVVNAMPA